MVERPISVLPSLLTMGNFSCGLLSIILCIQSIYWRGFGEEGLLKSGLLFQHACLIIFLGMVFDMLDGRVARMTNSQCKFGGELDSLADVCTFGLAPAVILATLWIRVMPNNAEWWSFSLIASIIYACCTMLRLAIYNLSFSEDAKGHFSGLPSPGAAGALVSTVLFLSQDYVVSIWSSLFSNKLQTAIASITSIGRDYRVIALYIFSTYVIVIGLLMVSKFRFAHAANIWLGKTRKLYTLYFMIIVICLLSIEKTRNVVLFLGFNAYIVICIFINIRNRIRNRESSIDQDMVEALNFEETEIAPEENDDKPLMETLVNESAESEKI